MTTMMPNAGVPTAANGTANAMPQTAAPAAGPDPQSYAMLKSINDQQNANQVMFMTFQAKISLSDKVYQICLGQIRNMEK
jgi:hypothetical protein